MNKASLTCVGLLLAASQLTACGLKGPLYLPESESQAAAASGQAQPTPAAAPTDKETQ